MKLAEGDHVNIQPQPVESLRQLPNGGAARNQWLDHGEHGRRHFRYARGFAQVCCLEQVFRRQQSDQMLVVLEIIGHEIEELKQALARIEVVDVDLHLPPAQTAKSLLQHNNVEVRFTAEIVVDHARIGSGVADDAADACAGKAVSDEFPRGRAQNLLAALRRASADARAPDHARTGRSDIDIAVSHAALVSAPGPANLVASSRSARSLPRAPTIDSPMGQPSRRPSGSATCGAPQWPATEVRVSARP